MLCNPVFLSLIHSALGLRNAHFKEELWLHVSRLTESWQVALPAKGRTHTKWCSRPSSLGSQPASPVLSPTILFHMHALSQLMINYLFRFPTSDYAWSPFPSLQLKILEGSGKINLSLLWLLVALYLYCPKGHMGVWFSLWTSRNLRKQPDILHLFASLLFI